MQRQLLDHCIPGTRPCKSLVDPAPCRFLRHAVGAMLGSESLRGLRHDAVSRWCGHSGVCTMQAPWSCKPENLPDLLPPQPGLTPVVPGQVRYTVIPSGTDRANYDQVLQKSLLRSGYLHGAVMQVSCWRERYAPLLLKLG